MRYLVDTNVLVSFSKGHEPEYSWMLGRIQSKDELGVCAVIVAEFFAGTSPANRPAWTRFLRRMNYWETTEASAMRAGIYRYTYARQGTAISTQDALIAAVAAEVRAIIVTGNVRHFPMPDVVLLTL